MIISILYIILALFGIGFLIFIHELGHYIMARRVGIKVETFAIGFGKPIYQWEHNGVKWKLGWLIFGGYVKMAGTEKEDGLEPYQIKDGYFGKSPWDRIKVTAMGPIVNIVFAFLAFTLLWAMGGREKPFSEYTHHIGYIEPESNLQSSGIRAGDYIETLNGRPFKGFNDFIYGAALDKQSLQITGYDVDYFHNKRTPFTYVFANESDLKGLEKASSVIQLISPAQFLITGKLPADSPLASQGVGENEQLLWLDGEMIFSQRQLIHVLNSPKVLLTVERNGEHFLTRVPKTLIGDLKLNSSQKAELDDWRHEGKLEKKLSDLAYIPYNLNAEGVVEGPTSYVDEKSEQKPYFVPTAGSYIEKPLMQGDRIVGVYGQKVSSSYELLKQIQNQKSFVIIKKYIRQPLSWKDADQAFEKSFYVDEMREIVDSMGSDHPITKTENLFLVGPITPVPLKEFPVSAAQHKEREEKFDKQKKTIDEMENTAQKEEAQKELNLYQNRMMLGFSLKEKGVAYNPAPWTLFGDVLKETYRTLAALLTGYLSPKHMMGPVGIVQVIQHGWSVGVKEAVFWLGMVSLNLGLLNLMPIPVLDGGYICIAIVESITKKPLKAKTLERLIIPFVILLIGLFVYLTYNDLVRIIKQFF